MNTENKTKGALDDWYKKVDWFLLTLALSVIVLIVAFLISKQ